LKTVNNTKLGVSAKRAVAVKIETHGLLAILTPEPYRHTIISILAVGYILARIFRSAQGCRKRCRPEMFESLRAREQVSA
jgi:hypothetical protein